MVVILITAQKPTTVDFLVHQEEYYSCNFIYLKNDL